MKTINSSIAQQEPTTNVDNKTLTDLFKLLLEWDMKDVQENAEKRKEISQKI